MRRLDKHSDDQFASLLNSLTETPSCEPPKSRLKDIHTYTTNGTLKRFRISADGCHTVIDGWNESSKKGDSGMQRHFPDKMKPAQHHVRETYQAEIALYRKNFTYLEALNAWAIGYGALPAIRTARPRYLPGWKNVNGESS